MNLNQWERVCWKESMLLAFLSNNIYITRLIKVEKPKWPSEINAWIRIISRQICYLRFKHSYDKQYLHWCWLELSFEVPYSRLEKFIYEQNKIKIINNFKIQTTKICKMKVALNFLIKTQQSYGKVKILRTEWISFKISDSWASYSSYEEFSNVWKLSNLDRERRLQKENCIRLRCVIMQCKIRTHLCSFCND